MTKKDSARKSRIAKASLEASTVIHNSTAEARARALIRLADILRDGGEIDMMFLQFSAMIDYLYLKNEIQTIKEMRKYTLAKIKEGYLFRIAMPEDKPDILDSEVIQ